MTGLVTFRLTVAEAEQLLLRFFSAEDAARILGAHERDGTDLSNAIVNALRDGKPPLGFVPR